MCGDRSSSWALGHIMLYNRGKVLTASVLLFPSTHCPECFMTVWGEKDKERIWEVN